LLLLFYKQRNRFFVIHTHTHTQVLGYWADLTGFGLAFKSTINVKVEDLLLPPAYLDLLYLRVQS
jgi:hypothetical protein